MVNIVDLLDSQCVCVYVCVCVCVYVCVCVPMHTENQCNYIFCIGVAA